MKHNLQIKKNMNISTSSSLLNSHVDSHQVSVVPTSSEHPSSLVDLKHHELLNTSCSQDLYSNTTCRTNNNSTDIEPNSAISDHLNEFNMIAEALDSNTHPESGSANKDTVKFSISDYEKHVRRLEFILDQEQNERLKVEGKLIDVMEELSELQYCDTVATGGTKTPTKSTRKSLFDGLFNNSNKKKENTSSFTSQISETFFKRSYNSREAVLSETLELAQQRIVQLVMELDTNNEGT